MSTTLFPLIPTLFVLAAGFAGGVPLGGRADAVVAFDAVAEHDRRLMRWLTAAGTVVLAGELLDAWSPSGAWLALAAAAGVGVPLAVDRWRRTNGDRRPFARLMEITAVVEGVPSTLGDEFRDQLAERLLDEIGPLPVELLSSLAEVEEDERCRERICRLLAAEALRTGRDGELVWLPADDEQRARRDALLALADAHPDVRQQVLGVAG